MRPIVLLLLAPLFSVAAQTDKTGDTSAVVEKPVKAHGGAAAIKKLRVATVTFTARGNLPFLPVAGDVDIEVEETYQMPRQIKKVIKGKAADMDIVLTWAIDGDKWWYQEKDGKTKVLNQKQDVEGQFRPYLVLEHLANHEQFQWSLAPDDGDKQRDEVSMRAKSEKAKFDGVFRFAKSTGLLAGMASGKALPGTTKGADTGVRFSEYKEIDGVKLPMRQTIYHDGKVVCDIRVSKVRFLEKIDDRVFAAP